MPDTKFVPEKYTGPKASEVLTKRKAYVHPSVLLYYKKPVCIVEGKGEWLWDDEGKRYLDAIAGIVTVSVGHCHPKVVQAIKRQNRLLMHTTTIYLHPNIGEFAEKLTSRLPKKLNTVYFVNSGSEANTLALEMARAYTKNYDFVALRNAYHGLGMAMGLTAHSTWKQQIPHGAGIHHAINPNTYRGTYLADDKDAAKKYASDIEDLILTATSGAVSGFICEPIQGVGGSVEMPKGYMKAAHEIVRKYGGLCISDEVQTGFGRCGNSYWGFQKDEDGVVPDIVTMAKGIGNGAPLAAVVTTREIAESLAKRVHFNTFGGNPVSCAAGSAVLDIIDEEKLQENSLIVGGYLIERLKELQSKYDIIGDVRGRGLMIGVEMVKDRKTKVPASVETLSIFETMKDLGVLIGKGGLFGNVLRIKPPMCFNKKDADFLVDTLEEAINKL